jgi:hypothetical protein
VWLTLEHPKHKFHTVSGGKFLGLFPTLSDENHCKMERKNANNYYFKFKNRDLCWLNDDSLLLKSDMYGKAWIIYIFFCSIYSPRKYKVVNPSSIWQVTISKQFIVYLIFCKIATQTGAQDQSANERSAWVKVSLVKKTSKTMNKLEKYHVTNKINKK